MANATARLGPGSVTWERLGDWRLLLAAQRALLLQVAHPVVAAGVDQHSTFRTDPWGRLTRSLDLLSAVIAGPDPAAAASSLRRMHRDIKGVDGAGHRYHAYDPDAWYWVHASTVDSVVVALRAFDRPLRGRERDRFYAEMCEVGRLLGVRDRDQPEDWRGFRAYVDHMVADRLVDNHMVQEVVRAPRHAPPPDLVPGPAWRTVRAPASQVSHVLNVGLLPPVLRRRWGLRWSPAHELAFRTEAAALRAVAPAVRALPDRLRLLPAYRAARRRPAVRDGAEAVGR